MSVKFPEIEVQLTGNDGNSFAIMGTVQKALKKAKVSQEDIDQYMRDSMNGDYNNLLQVAMKTVTVL